MTIFKSISIWLWQLERSDFYRDLADSFTRGVGLREFLSSGIRNAGILKRKNTKVVFELLLQRLNAGYGTTYSELLSGIVPRADYMLLTVVDDAKDDQKANSLLAIASAVQFKKSVSQSLMKNLIMPIFVGVLTGAVAYITAQSIEMIAQTIEMPGLWVGFNGSVRTLSNFILNNVVEIILTIVGVVAAFVWYLPRWTGRLRLRFDNWPLANSYRSYQGAIVLTALATMLAADKNIVDAVDSLRKRGSPWLRWQLGRMNQALINAPGDYLLAISRGLFPPLVQARLASLMDSTGLDAALVQLGQKEISFLKTKLDAMFVVMNWTFSILISCVAIYLMIGQMLIASDMSSLSQSITN